MALPKGKLLTLLVVFAAIGLVTATGAFTTVSATRTADVSVSGDSGALLGLNPGNNPYASTTSSGTLQINMNKINLNSETKVKVVFTLTNNAPSDASEVAVSFTNFDYQDGTTDTDETANHEDAVDFVVSESELTGTSGLGSGITTISGTQYYSLNDNTIDIGTGDSVEVGMYIDTTSSAASSLSANGNADNQDILDEVDITADADNTDGDTDSSSGNLDAASDS